MSNDLVSHLIAETKGWDTGIDHAEKLLHSFEHEVKHTLLGVAGAFGIGFGLERGMEAIKGQIEAVTELGHLSERTGIGVNDLQALQREAKQAGLEFETLSKGITKMSINIADSTAGGQKGKYFDQLGLDVRKLMAENPGQQFRDVAEAISHVGNQTDRTHMAFEIFGKTGAEMLGVIQKGAEGLDQARHALDASGKLLKPEEVEEVEKAHLAMQSLEGSITGLARTFAIELAPGIATAANEMANFINQSNKGIKAHGGGDNSHDNTHDASWWQTTKWLGQITLGGAQMGAGIAESGAGGMMSPFIGVDNFMMKAGRETAEAGTKNWGEFWESFIWGATEAQKAAEKATEAAARQDASLAQQEAERVAREKQDKEDARDDAREDADRLQKAQRIYEQSRTPKQKFADEFDQLQSLSDILDPETLDQSLLKIADDFKKEMDKIDPLKEMRKDAEGFLKGIETHSETFEHNIKAIDELNLRGLLTNEQYDRAMAHEAEQYRTAEGLDKSGKPKHAAHEKQWAAANEYGTKEAYSAILKATQPHVDEYAKKQVELQQKNIDINNDISLKMSQLVTNTKPATVVSIPP